MTAFVRHSAIPASIPEQNVTVSPLELHMEILNPRTADVWLCQEPLTMEDYRAFKPEAPFIKSGIGRSAMSFAYFLRSPGATEDGPLEQCEMGGRRFVRVARPIKFRGLAPGQAPTKLSIDKHHVIGYAAGERVPFVRLPDGQYYVQQTRSADGSVLPLPDDWRPCHVDLTQDWAVSLPSPPTVYFFTNLQSFQGPVSEADLPRDPMKAGAGD